MKILQYELDIQYPRFQHCSEGVGCGGDGGGGCSEALPYSKFHHISGEQMMTEHRGLSVYVLTL